MKKRSSAPTSKHNSRNARKPSKYTSSLFLNAQGRSTLARRGASSRELWSWRLALKSDVMRISEGFALLAVCHERMEFRQIYSSFHITVTTSYQQLTWFIILIETACVFPQLNGYQLRQIYASFSFWDSHCQIQHENSCGMHLYQVGWKSIQAGLFFTLDSMHPLSSTKAEHSSNTLYLHINDFSSGKSIHHHPSLSFTLKHSMRTLREWVRTNPHSL